MVFPCKLPNIQLFNYVEGSEGDVRNEDNQLEVSNNSNNSCSENKKEKMETIIISEKCDSIFV